MAETPDGTRPCATGVNALAVSSGVRPKCTNPAPPAAGPAGPAAPGPWTAATPPSRSSALPRPRVDFGEAPLPDGTDAAIRWRQPCRCGASVPAETLPGTCSRRDVQQGPREGDAAPSHRAGTMASWLTQGPDNGAAAPSATAGLAARAVPAACSPKMRSRAATDALPAQVAGAESCGPNRVRATRCRTRIPGRQDANGCRCRRQVVEWRSSRPGRRAGPQPKRPVT